MFKAHNTKRNGMLNNDIGSLSKPYSVRGKGMVGAKTMSNVKIYPGRMRLQRMMIDSME